MYQILYEKSSQSNYFSLNFFNNSVSSFKSSKSPTTSIRAFIFLRSSAWNCPSSVSRISPAPSGSRRGRILWCIGRSFQKVVPWTNMSNENVEITFEQLTAKTVGTPDYGRFSILRARIPHGWLVLYDTSVCFVPDINHAWDGHSI